MKYKRLLTAFPFIAMFFILSITVEFNVIAEYSIVTVVNRVLVLAVALFCVMIVIPRLNLKWFIALGILAIAYVRIVLDDTVIGRNYYRLDGEYHVPYFDCLLYFGLFVFWFCGFDIIKKLWRKFQQKKKVAF